MSAVNRPLIIGHRGARACEAENTLASFRRAIAMGVDMIEFDVHVCKSGELIVIHDSTLTRTTNGRGFVNRMTLREIKRFHCTNGERVPTLEETLRAVGNRVRMNVELKSRASARAAAAFFRHRDISGIEFSSFKWGALFILRRYLPAAKMGLLVTKRSSRLFPFAVAKKLGCASINPPASVLNPAFINKARKKGLKVLVFGLRGPNDLEKCFRLKADGVFADDPAGALEAWRAFSPANRSKGARPGR